MKKKKPLVKSGCENLYLYNSTTGLAGQLKRSDDLMKYQTVMVDPKKAEEWLLFNNKNRRINFSKVNEYANLMKNGRWSLNGTTICFSIDGRLLDGQHRLHAVIQSGATVPMSVVCGVDDKDAFITYDVGLRRNVSQEAALRGIKCATNIAAIAKKLLMWDKTQDKTRFSLTYATKLCISPYDVLKYLEENYPEIQDMFEKMSASLPCRKCGSGSSLVAALIICYRQNSVITENFITGLITGDLLPSNSPVGLLRDRFIAGIRKRNLNHETEVMALTIKAWNKYATGLSAKTLRWTQDKENKEYFPVPWGVSKQS